MMLVDRLNNREFSIDRSTSGLYNIIVESFDVATEFFIVSKI